ncbi:hypothetical protein COB55_05240 [Candidatus Wolfebacteria bacterium]|nr:MAG: hypothetical protein COB55_05240 [Candidatus Wolfebacteria bacterium]
MQSVGKNTKAVCYAREQHMNPNNFQQASFIPKKPISRGAGVRNARPSSVGVFYSISVLVFAVVVILAIGMFAYEKTLERQIEARRVLLENQSDALELSFVAEATQTHDQLDALTDILKGHVRASELFTVLGATTLKSVQFTGFEFIHNENPTIQLEGVAQSFASLALQADAFRENEKIISVSIANINLDESGNVVFSSQLILDPIVVEYADQFRTDI